MPTTLASLAPANSRALALPVPPIAMVCAVLQIIGLIGPHAPTRLDEKRAFSCASVSGSSAEAQYLSVMPSQPSVTLKLTDLASSIFL
jgi:hypothetical protein